MRNLSSHRASVLIGMLLAWGMEVVLAAGLTGQSFEEARRHWAYQPVRRPVPPAVKTADRVRSPIDAFLLARLEAKGLGFAPPADTRILLRRLYYDLIGLPPTADEVATFSRAALGEPRAAIESVVDRLLADPRYGERWGRHWLDVARYADTKDLVLLYGRDAIRPYAYTYRDYVVRALNEDVPYDEFIRDQLAADLAGPDLPRWRLGALGFLTLGRLFDNNPHDQIDDQIDTVTRGLLGLTVACARCHDHKYDAIKAADYYGLYGVFASTERPYALPLIEDPPACPAAPNPRRSSRRPGASSRPTSTPSSSGSPRSSAGGSVIIWSVRRRPRRTSPRRPSSGSRSRPMIFVRRWSNAHADSSRSAPSPTIASSARGRC